MDRLRHRLRPLATPVVVALVIAALLAASPAHAAPDETGEARLLKRHYLAGLSRIVRGDPAGAVAAFRQVSEGAAMLPQAHYALAAAMVLADFEHRERALPLVERALAAEPSQPLYEIVRLIADPALAVRRGDGLHFRADAARRLAAAAGRLGAAPEAYNGVYLAAALAALEPTGDPRYPVRLAKLDAMLGAGGRIALMPFDDSFTFGRLFALAVPDSRFEAALRPAAVTAMAR